MLFPQLKDTFPLAVWEGPRKFAMNTQDEANVRYAQIKQAGFQIVYLFSECNDKEWYDRCLTAATANDMYVILDTGAKWRDINDPQFIRWLSETSRNDRVLGYNIVDEPPYTWFPELAKCADIIRQTVGHKSVFVNLNPSYAPACYLPEGCGSVDESYKQYLNGFADAVKVDFLSFDYYPYIGNERETDMLEGLIRNLCAISSTGRKYGLPFAGFAQGSRWGKYGNDGEWLGTRIPTDTEYAYLSYIHICFGASMLSTFLYWSRSGKRADQRVPGVFDGLVTEVGVPTRLYYATQKCNTAIQTQASIIAGYKHLGVFGLGCPSVISKALSSVSEFEPLLKDFTIGANSPALVGVFEKSGQALLYVVNQSTRQQVTVCVTTTRDYTVFDENGMPVKKYESGSGDKNCTNYHVPCGSVMLFKLG